uniref:Uncharacterized protein n=1 Tax=Siphoviridae sp. ctevH2 TaxID=2825593 RepID=A0A8S5UAP1_9CAUD|nr:MAG TPA: hypothetical protein [Siphoviridae sp. ctevH2]
MGCDSWEFSVYSRICVQILIVRGHHGADPLSPAAAT